MNAEDASSLQVAYLHGVQKLLVLLQSEVEELEQAAAGALRNLVFESNQNKMEVRDCEGVPIILRLLRRSRDTETRRQLTGELCCAVLDFTVCLCCSTTEQVFVLK